MDIREQYPLGAKDERWQDLAIWIDKMDKLGSTVIEVMAKQLPWIADKDFSKPDSFSDEEVWEYLQTISDNEE